MVGFLRVSGADVSSGTNHGFSLTRVCFHAEPSEEVGKVVNCRLKPLAITSSNKAVICIKSGEAECYRLAKAFAGNLSIVINNKGEPFTNDGVCYDVEELRGEYASLGEASSGVEGVAVEATLSGHNFLLFPEGGDEAAAARAEAVFFEGLEESWAVDGIVSFLEVEKNEV